MRGTNIRAVTVVGLSFCVRAGAYLPSAAAISSSGRDFAKLGNPITAVYSPSRRREDILKNIRAGHSFVSSGVDGARLTLTLRRCNDGRRCSL